MVTTRAGAKRKEIEDNSSLPIESIKRQLIASGAISAKKCPNDRMLRLLYQRVQNSPSKRQKCDRTNVNDSHRNSLEVDTDVRAGSSSHHDALTGKPSVPRQFFLSEFG